MPCNFFFELQCRHTRKYAIAHGVIAEKACIAPPAQCIPINTDIKPATNNPTEARDCGVFRMSDFFSAGKETRQTRAARISSMRTTASGPNKTGGVR